LPITGENTEKLFTKIEMIGNELSTGNLYLEVKSVKNLEWIAE
jgi:hypothetical protein